MGDRIHLADPSFEPTDEQLEKLSTRAFADVAAANERSMDRIRAEIARRRDDVLRSLTERMAARSAPRQ